MFEASSYREIETERIAQTGHSKPNVVIMSKANERPRHFTWRILAHLVSSSLTKCWRRIGKSIEQIQSHCYELRVAWVFSFGPMGWKYTAILVHRNYRCSLWRHNQLRIRFMGESRKAKKRYKDLRYIANSWKMRLMRLIMARKCAHHILDDAPGNWILTAIQKNQHERAFTTDAM